MAISAQILRTLPSTGKKVKKWEWITRSIFLKRLFKVKSLVGEQTKEWSELLKRQQNDEYTLRKTHRRQQWDLLKELMAEVQKVQMEDLQKKHQA